MDPIINFLNDIFWGYVLIYGLLAVGLFFTVRLGFVQFLQFPEMFKSVLGSKKNDKSGITPFQALCTSLASRVGTGNLAGVAVALYLGGPGALFWMWMVALVRIGGIHAGATLQDPKSGRRLSRWPGLLHCARSGSALGGWHFLGLPDHRLRAGVQRRAGQFDCRCLPGRLRL